MSMTQVKQFSGFLGGLILRILACILAGTVALTLIFCLPQGNVRENMALSAAVFQEEGSYPTVNGGFSGQLDNQTDGIILMNAAFYSPLSPLQEAMLGMRDIIPGTEGVPEDIVRHYIQGEPFGDTEAYARYWHGYVLYVRPLLMLTSYQGIRICNGILQAALLGVLLWMLVRRNREDLALACLICLLFLTPQAMFRSLQFTSCYCIMMTGAIAAVRQGGAPGRKEAWLFAYIGIATAYFDFLTYPIATLVFPAAICFCMRQCENWKHTLCRGIRLCFSWGVGYVGMWAGKWLLAGMITGINVLGDASAQFVERSYAGSQSNGLLHGMYVALVTNVRTCFETPVTLILALAVMILLFLLLRQWKQRGFRLAETAEILFPFIVLACIPVAWLAVTAQHATVHHWFTHRGLCAFVFAALCGLCQCLRTGSKPQ